MRIAVLGAGYAGLVTAASLVDFGHAVTALDLDSARIASLRNGKSPIFEPGLDDLIARGIGSGRFEVADSYDDLPIGSFDMVFLVVGTPADDDGSVDLSQLDAAVTSMAPTLREGTTVVVKSTVPVGTAARVRESIAGLRPDIRVGIASNPEFLRQGSAVHDFSHPDRIVIGTDTDEAEAAMRRVYGPLLESGVTAVFTSLESAELIKYAANAFLATKLSFINEIADLCEAAGASVEDVARGIGLDHRIGSGYLRAGPGFGGSCLPKDVQALLRTSRGLGAGSRIVGAALEVNEQRVPRMVDRIADSIGTVEGRVVALLGLTFKADTDDLRQSPALRIASELLQRGAVVRVFDPQGMDGAQIVLGDSVTYAANEYEAAAGADVAVIATEWKQFGSLSLPRLHEALAQPIVVDLRNMWDPAEMAGAGFRYFAIGQPDPA